MEKIISIEKKEIIRYTPIEERLQKDIDSILTAIDTGRFYYSTKGPLNEEIPLDEEIVLFYPAVKQYVITTKRQVLLDILKGEENETI